MRAVMRIFWSRWLLCAVLFNTVFGLASHEAGHLAGPLGVQLVAPAHAAGSSPDAPDEAPDDAHGACLGCQAHSPSALAISPPAALPPRLPAARALPLASAPAGPGPGTDAWPFASRDPPSGG